MPSGLDLPELPCNHDDVAVSCCVKLCAVLVHMVWGYANRVKLVLALRLTAPNMGNLSELPEALV